MGTDRIETFRRAQNWKTEETPKRRWHKKPSSLVIIGGAIGFIFPVLVWLIESGWFNLPPKAYELNNVKDDVARIEKRLDTLDGRIYGLGEKIDGRLDRITETLETLAEKTAATGAKLDAMSVISPPPQTPSYKPPAKPRKPHRNPVRTGQR